MHKSWKAAGQWCYEDQHSVWLQRHPLQKPDTHAQKFCHPGRYVSYVLCLRCSEKVLTSSLTLQKAPRLQALFISDPGIIFCGWPPLTKLFWFFKLLSDNGWICIFLNATKGKSPLCPFRRIASGTFKYLLHICTQATNVPTKSTTTAYFESSFKDESPSNPASSIFSVCPEKLHSTSNRVEQQTTEGVASWEACSELCKRRRDCRDCP